MAMASVRCPVLGGYVTFVMDLEGAVSRIFCPQYDSSTSTCRLKTSALAGGPLSQFLERVSEDGLRTSTTMCVLYAG
jgi:hypothetical protein